MTLDLAPAFSQPSTYGGPAGTVHHGYSTAKADLAAVRAEYSLVGPTNAWYAKLEPGGFIVPHIDKGPWWERWHIPVAGVGYCWQEGEIDEANFNPRTELYAIRHWEGHAVWNPFVEPRVILIVEYPRQIQRQATDLILEPMIPEVQVMIDAL